MCKELTKEELAKIIKGSIERKDGCESTTCTCRFGPQYNCFEPLGALGSFSYHGEG